MINFQQDIWTNFGDDAVPYMATHTISSGMLTFIVMIGLLLIAAIYHERKK